MQEIIHQGYLVVTKFKLWSSLLARPPPHPGSFLKAPMPLP